MPEVFDYDDESYDMSVVADSPEDVTFVRDGLTMFLADSNRSVLRILDVE